jgi:predicted dehydrogenase
MLKFDDMNLNEPLRLWDKQVSDGSDRQTVVDSFASFRASVPTAEISLLEVPSGEPLATQCAHFLDCIASGKQPFTDGRQGIGVVRALEAMQRSIRARGCEERVEASC